MKRIGRNTERVINSFELVCCPRCIMSIYVIPMTIKKLVLSCNRTVLRYCVRPRKSSLNANDAKAMSISCHSSNPYAKGCLSSLCFAHTSFASKQMFWHCVRHMSIRLTLPCHPVHLDLSQLGKLLCLIPGAHTGDTHFSPIALTSTPALGSD